MRTRSRRVWAARVGRAEDLGAAPAGERAADERAWQDYVAGLAEALPAGTIAVLPVMPDRTPLRTAPAGDLRAFRVSALRYTSPASLAGRPGPGAPGPARPAGRGPG